MKDIRIGTFRALPGLWSYGFSFSRDYMRYDGYRISLWCFKLKYMPNKGESLQRNTHYIGINWSFGFLIKFSIYN